MRVKNLIVGHQEWLICCQELGYENPTGTEQIYTIICIKFSEQGYSHGRDFYLDVDIPIFVTAFWTTFTWLHTSLSYLEMEEKSSACFNIDDWSEADIF